MHILISPSKLWAKRCALYKAKCGPYYACRFCALWLLHVEPEPCPGGVHQQEADYKQVNIQCRF